MNDMTSLTESFFCYYFSIFPLTYKIYINHIDFIKDPLTENEKILCYYDYKLRMHKLPHFKISNTSKISSFLNVLEV